MSSTRRLSTALALGAVAVTLLAAPMAAAAKTVWVDDDGQAGPASCAGTAVAPKKVAGGIKAAAAGDTIKVCPGQYAGTVRITKNNLTVVSTTAQGAVLKPPADRTKADHVVFITADGVTFKNFRVLVPSGGRTAGECDLPSLGGLNAYDASGMLITGTRIEGDDGPTSGTCGLVWGIFTETSSGTITNTTVRNFSQLGMQLDRGRVLVRGNTISYGHPGTTDLVGLRGIWLLGGSSSAIDNTIGVEPGTANNLDVGIVADGTKGGVIGGNTIGGVDTGIWADLKADGRIEDNVVTGAATGSVTGILIDRVDGAASSPALIIQRNTVTRFGEYGILADRSADHLIRNNTVTGNTTDCRDTENPLPNTWTQNKGSDVNTSEPVGLCDPAFMGAP
ncbi:MAG: right-handed parallel beta-helix repeat-containing protein [Chloroflexota bacterium]